MIFSTWMWIAAGVVTAIGLLLLAWSLRGDRARGRRRCPKCWYQLQGVPGLRCPECGREARRERDLLRPRRRWRIATLALLIMLAAPSFIAYRQFREYGWYWLLPKYRVASERLIGGWRVQLLLVRDQEHDYGEALRIRRGWSTKFMLESPHISLGETNSADNDAPFVGLGEDITGDGVPDLIVGDYSGGAHCCMTYHIISLAGDGVCDLQSIDTQHAFARFEDLDGDGRPEMITAENGFAYWNSSFAGSPFPRVILKWTNGQYRVAHDLMRQPAPDEAKLAADAKSIRKSDRWSKDGYMPPVELWGEMPDLIYTGHADLAWQLLRDAWPEDRLGRMMFLVDFIAQLSAGQYWEEVRAMNLLSGVPAAGMAMP